MKYREVDLNEEFLSKLYESGSEEWQTGPPAKLFAIGDFPKDRKTRKVVAIVGSRASTSYGERIAYDAAKLLAENGVIVVSGLAYGIDAAAHRGCLAGGGETVAVLGTPIDSIYPRCNLSLAEKMLENGGAIVSEYAPGDPVTRGNFTYRNRIVSGLADALLVVEASDHSGTISTVNFALEQGRDIYAVPGDIDRETSAGTNRLILDGAKMYLSAKGFLGDVLPDWRKRKTEAIAQKYGEDAWRIIVSIEEGSDTIDGLVEMLEMDAEKVLSELGVLEVEGLVIIEGENVRLLKN